MKFEYDINKSVGNRAKHGISFEEAKFLWVVKSVEIEARPTLGEQRVMRIGCLGSKFYSCIYTARGDVIRLISIRRSRKNEEKIYEEEIKEEKNDNN